METQVNKSKGLVRHPPGDRWIPADCPSPVPDEMIFENLTSGLDWLYQNYECRKFIVDAENEIVYMITDENDVKKPSGDKYSIYGE